MSRCEHEWKTEEINMSFYDACIEDYDMSMCIKCGKMTNNSSDWDMLMGEV